MLIALIIMLIVLLAWLSTRLFFAAPLVIDQQWDPRDGRDLSLGPWDRAVAAIKTSWRLTGPYTMSLVGLSLSLGLAIVASLLLLCVGIILLGMPLYYAIMGCAYVMLTALIRNGRCPECGFPLQGVAGPICPGCGATRPS